MVCDEVVVCTVKAIVICRRTVLHPLGYPRCSHRLHHREQGLAGHNRARVGPRFNDEVGGKSYWFLFSLNVVALISVILILPETKGISLERMDKIFGQVDAVEGGEEEDPKAVAVVEGETAARSSSGDVEKVGTLEHVEMSNKRD